MKVVWLAVAALVGGVLVLGIYSETGHQDVPRSSCSGPFAPNDPLLDACVERRGVDPSPTTIAAIATPSTTTETPAPTTSAPPTPTTSVVAQQRQVPTQCILDSLDAQITGDTKPAC